MMADRRFTDIELERQLAGDLPASRAFDTQATDADRARLGELRAEHEAFMRSVDVDNEVKRIQQRVARAAPEKKVWWKWLVPASALAAAAAVVLVVMRRGGETTHKPDEDDIQVKGDAVSLIVHEATEGGSRRLASGDEVHPGDRIRFEVNALKPGFVAIVGIDGSGSVSIYYPASGNEPLAFDPGTRVLPDAIALDDTPGDEHFYAIYSTHLFTLESVTSAMQAKAPLPPGVAKAEVVLHKKVP